MTSIGFISLAVAALDLITKAKSSAVDLIWVHVITMSKKKEKVICDLPTELRCKRTDNKAWRCANQRTEDSGYCEHHRVKIRENYQRRKNRKTGYSTLHSY